ncbi:hypothetical protein AAZV13_17G156900 [Glycine max]|eukprot:XP_006600979.1 uncharacterized protein LOC100812851 isoform X4 [Glycine max]
MIMYMVWLSRDFTGNRNFVRMWKPRVVPSVLSLLLLLHSLLAMVSAQGINRTTWNTLTGELYSVVCSPIDAALVATAGGDDRGFLWKIGQADWAFELQGNGFLRGFLHLGITYHSILKANMKKVKHLVEPPDSKTKLSLWKADLAQEGSFDEAIKGCTGVFHVATPMDFDSKDTEGKIKQTMDKAFWDGIMENEAGEKRPCITFFQRHGWSIMKFIPYGTVYVGICVV